jgi:aldehyde:ferredoxin oxidoreductase
MKCAGYEGVLVSGRSRHPVYLVIREGHAEVKTAEHLWGKDTIETANTIKSDLCESKARIASIGPAGERLVRYASIVTDEMRFCGRAGMGAVMGSKNLKALVVRGTIRISLANEEKVRELSNEARDSIKPSKAPTYTVGRVRALSVDGTAGGLEGLEKQGGLPIKNWREGGFPEAANISGPIMTKTILARPGMCPHCTIITCWRFVRSTDGGLRHGPEYETLAALGSLCLNDNLESIVKANDICNGLGMDTISTGCAIAFAMECYEKGVLNKDDVGGLDLRWGNSDAICELTKLIGLKEGFGAVLAEGVRRAAEKIGRGSERYAMHVKGMELPMHEPRRWWTMALNYATANRGACHCQGAPMYLETGYLQPEFGFSEKLKPFEMQGMSAATKFHQDFHAAFTSMGHCVFTIGGVIPFTIVTKAFEAVTGRRVSHWDLLKSGERIWNVKRVFNLRFGVTEKDDTLPGRFLDEPLIEGPAAGKTPPLQEMVEEYYLLRGWKEGKPTRAKLRELGMPEIAKDIWG